MNGYTLKNSPHNISGDYLYDVIAPDGFACGTIKTVLTEGGGPPTAEGFELKANIRDDRQGRWDGPVQDLGMTSFLDDAMLRLADFDQEELSGTPTVHEILNDVADEDDEEESYLLTEQEARDMIWVELPEMGYFELMEILQRYKYSNGKKPWEHYVIVDEYDYDDDWIMEHQDEVKKKLKELAREGASRPEPGTMLGRALEVFPDDEMLANWEW